MRKIKLLLPIVGITCIASTVPSLVSCSKNKFHFDSTDAKWKIEKRTAEEWDVDNATQIYFNEAKKNIRIFAEDIARSLFHVESNPSATLDVTINKIDPVNHLLSFRLDVVETVSASSIKVSFDCKDIEYVVETDLETMDHYTLYPKAQYDYLVQEDPQTFINTLNKNEKWSVVVTEEDVSNDFNKTNIETKVDELANTFRKLGTFNSYYLSDMELPPIDKDFQYNTPFVDWKIGPRSTSGWVEDQAQGIYFNEINQNCEILVEDLAYYNIGGITDEGVALNIHIQDINTEKNTIDFSIETDDQRGERRYVKYEFNKVEFSVVPDYSGTTPYWVIEPRAYYESLKALDMNTAKQFLNQNEGWSIKATSGAEEHEFNAQVIEVPEEFEVCFEVLAENIFIPKYLQNVSVPKQKDFRYRKGSSQWKVAPRGTDGWDDDEASSIYLKEAEAQYDIIVEDVANDLLSDADFGTILEFHLENLDSEKQIFDFSYTYTPVEDAFEKISVEFHNVAFCISDYLQDDWSLCPCCIAIWEKTSESSVIPEVLNQNEGWYITLNIGLQTITFNSSNISDSEVLQAFISVVPEVSAFVPKYLSNIPAPE